MELAHQSRDCWVSAISAAAVRKPGLNGSGCRKFFIYAGNLEATFEVFNDRHGQGLWKTAD